MRLRRPEGSLLLPVLLWLVLMTAPACASTEQSPKVNPGLRAALMNAVNKSDSFQNRYMAEVWLKDMSTRLASQIAGVERRMKLLRMVYEEAKRAGLSPNMVLAVIQVESSFQHYALSSAGARGLMQVMPFWIEEIGQPQDNLFDIRTNLRYGCTILAFYLDKEDGNLMRALARYNGSLGEYWYPALVLQALHSRWYRR